MSTLKVIKKLEHNQFIVEVVGEQKISSGITKEFILQHDYVEFRGNTNYGSSPVWYSGDPNRIDGIDVSVRIPIRMFKTVILPMLNESDSLQDEHFKTRKDPEGDYEPYAYHSSVTLHYYDKKNKVKMVAVLLKGDTVPSRMTHAFWKKVYTDEKK